MYVFSSKKLGMENIYRSKKKKILNLKFIDNDRYNSELLKFIV